MCMHQSWFIVEDIEANVLENRIKLSPESLDRKVKKQFTTILEGHFFTSKCKFLPLHLNLIFQEQMCWGFFLTLNSD